MAGIAPIFTSQQAEASHCISLSSTCMTGLPKSTVGGVSSPPDWVVKFEILLVFSNAICFCFINLAWKNGVGILPIFTFPGEIEWSHLGIGLAELAATTGRDVIISLVIEFRICFVFKSHFVFASHENGMEEWSAFHQYSHLLRQNQSIPSL